jgi:leucyl/phenylalanyl-tRNA---protein transferase
MFIQTKTVSLLSVKIERMENGSFDIPICQEEDRPPFWIPAHLGDESGLVGVGGNLKPETLLMAYRCGVFPWFSEGDPILWFSPEPRGIIPLEAVHVSKRLQRTIRQNKFQVTVNRQFRDVMMACGENREDGTWVTDSMIDAFCELHRLGHAHSVEVWQNQELVGGTYGVGIAGLFAAESMFHRITDASKVALVYLIERLKKNRFSLLDIQMVSNHTATFGAVDIERNDYLGLLQQALASKQTTPFNLD